MNTNQELFRFIKNSPSAYHTVKTVKAELLKEGFTELFESDAWELSDGGKYFVIRNGTSIIAFVNRKANGGFMISASHSDSPSFRLKANNDKSGELARLDVEKYGGMIYYSWLDRPLSLAGRVVLSTECGIETRLLNIDSDIATIPSVAIHFNRTVNDGYKFNPAVDMLPLIASGGKSIMSLIAKELNTTPDKIISHDLFLYNRDEGREFGLENEFILAPRLDDLECVFASLCGFLSAKETSSTPVLAIFDNEEVGSETKQGAASTFLSDTLSRIAGDAYRTALAKSLMLSADNAHARHPNHPELSDAENAPRMNGGVVIKWNANQRYATDGLSASLFLKICERAGVKTQNYYNRADMLGGSTLGSISDTKVSVPTVDIGLAQLAMHSANETAGALDLSEMISAMTEFFGTSVEIDGDAVSLK